MHKTPTPRKTLPKEMKPADNPALPLYREAPAAGSTPKPIPSPKTPRTAAALPLILSDAPHFNIGPVSSGTDWFKWLLLLLMALLTGAMGYLLMPTIARYL